MAVIGSSMSAPIRSNVGGFHGINFASQDEGIVEIEYLESNGKQWIDTGIYGNDMLECQLEICPLETGSDKPIMCVDGGSSFNNAFSFMIQSKYFRGIMQSVYRDSYGDSIAYLFPQVGQWYTVKISSMGIWCDANNHLYRFSSNVPTYATAYTIPLFAWKRNNKIIVKGKLRVASVKMYENGILLRDFVPIRFKSRRWQMEGAMLDKVSSELFLNEGTENFILGPDVGEQ